MFFKHFSMDSILNALSDLFLLRCVGVTFDYRGINWYVSPFFYGSLLYCFLFSAMKRRGAILSTGILTGLSFTFLINYGRGTFLRETACYIISLGLLRATGGLGTGILLCIFLEHFRKLQHLLFPNMKIRGLIFSAVEIVTFLLLLKIFLFGGPCPNKFSIVLLFSLLFACFVLRFGILSRLCDQKIFYALGRYSYSIYVMQQISFVILGATLWRIFVVRYPICCLAISLFFCTFVGIAVYYLIERPCFVWFLRRTESLKER